MSIQNNNQTIPDESSVNFQSFSLMLVAMSAGMLLAMLVLPHWAPNIAASLLGSDPKAFWYLSRATAFVAMGLLWLSMALGLGITNKLAHLWPGGPTAFAIHEYTSLLGMVFVIFHALLLMGDHYIHFTLAQLLIPFSTQSYQPLWVGFGQIGFYISLIITLSFYVRKRIGQKVWRVMHYASFLSYAAALLHGLAAGTDTGTVWAQWFYWLTAGSLLFLFIYRVLFRLISTTNKVVQPAEIAPQLQRVPVEVRNDQD